MENKILLINNFNKKYRIRIFSLKKFKKLRKLKYLKILITLRL